MHEEYPERESDMIDIDCEVLSITPSAVWISIDPFKPDICLPRSEIRWSEELGHVTIEMPEWLAIEKGLE